MKKFFTCIAVIAVASLFISCQKDNELPSTGNITFNPHELTLEPESSSDIQAVCYFAGYINENVPFTLKSDSEFLVVDETIVYKGLNNLVVKSTYQGEDWIKTNIYAYALASSLGGYSES